MHDISSKLRGTTNGERAIILRNVCKTYKLYNGPKEMAADQLGFYKLKFWKPAPIFEEFQALKNVSFELKHGERYGIVGRNGAGFQNFNL